MNFTSSHARYTNRFLSHFMGFIKRYNLFSEFDSLVVTVSGGIDSIALLFAIYQIQRYGYSNSVRVIHINHNTRKTQTEEEYFVENFCKHLGVSLTVNKLENLATDKNFENNARIKRYEAFYDFASPKEKILLAHHIDDSFEWTMLQSLRSSSIEGLIGIPVINGRIIRPFMCVTKFQIKKFVNAYDIPFMEDPTNEQIKYERNFIRNEVITAFSHRYLNYLKHYVYRHNEISRRLGLHLLDKNRSAFQISFARDSVLIYNISTQIDVSGLEDLVLKAIKHLNPFQRGSLNQQLYKVSQALLNNKTGPLVLSGGFQVYIDFNCILITKKIREKILKSAWPKDRYFTFDEFVSYLSEEITHKKNHFNFPFIFKLATRNLDYRQFGISFNSETEKWLKQNDICYYPGLKLMREWSKKRNLHKVLKLNYYV